MMLPASSLLSPARVVQPTSWVGHIPFAFWIIEALSPRIFVELGTHTGNSYFAFCQSVAHHKLDTRCYAVDTWKGDPHAGFYDNRVYEDVSAYHDRHYAAFSRLMRMTFDDAACHFSDRSIDLLHIDGLHTYEAVRHDFELWLPKMSDRGVVLFHDINVRANDFGVWKFWEEACRLYPYVSFEHSHGLGVLLTGMKQEELFKGMNGDVRPAQWRSALKACFCRLGRAVELEYRNEELSRQSAMTAERNEQLTRQLDSCSEECKRLSVQISRQVTESGLLSDSLRESRVQVREHHEKSLLQQQHILLLEQKISAMRNSGSWKMTKHFRKIASSFRKRTGRKTR